MLATVAGSLTAVAACAEKGEPQSSQPATVFSWVTTDSNNIERDTEYCVYIVEKTLCTQSNVPQKRWVAVVPNLRFDHKDGLTLEEMAAGHLLNLWVDGDYVPITGEFATLEKLLAANDDKASFDARWQAYLDSTLTSRSPLPIPSQS